MNILVILSAVVGVAIAQQGDIKDCEPRQSAISVRDVQDIYQRPIAYDTVDYTPHSTYGPPEPVRSAPRRTYPQDISDGASAPRPAFAQPPAYSDIRQQFPFAPVYGPPPPRARVAAAAGIYDDYEDIQYAQPAQAPPVALLPVSVPVRRYNVNYAQREPYQPNYGYDVYSSRHREYRVPVYYAPLPEGYYPVRLTPPPAPTTTTTTTTTTEEPRTQPPPVTIPITQPIIQHDEVVYDTTQYRRHPPYVAVASSEEEAPRHRFKKPFSLLGNLFRGSIIAARNKIGVIPSIVQSSVNKLT